MDFSLISFKRALSLAQTSQNKLYYNEQYYVPTQAGSFTVFAQKPAIIPPKNIWDTDFIVEKVRLTIDPILGTESLRGTQGYKIRLPDNYSSVSKNPSKGEYPWSNGQVLSLTDGRIQIVSKAIGGENYGYKVFDADMNEISPIGPAQWILYESNGIIYVQNPPGCEENPSLTPGVPAFIECFIYIGKMLSDLVVYRSSSSSSSSFSSSSSSLSSSSFSSSSSSCSSSSAAPVDANVFVWIQPSELTYGEEGVIYTPHRFRRKSLIVYRRGLAVAAEHEDGFIVLSETSFQLKEPLSGQNDWIMIGYSSKDYISD